MPSDGMVSCTNLQHLMRRFQQITKSKQHISHIQYVICRGNTPKTGTIHPDLCQKDYKILRIGLFIDILFLYITHFENLSIYFHSYLNI